MAFGHTPQPSPLPRRGRGDIADKGGDLVGGVGEAYAFRRGGLSRKRKSAPPFSGRTDYSNRLAIRIVRELRQAAVPFRAAPASSRVPVRAPRDAADARFTANV